MPHIDTAQGLTIFIGNLPTFLAVVLAWMHSNSRTSDMDLNLSRRIDDTRDLLRAEFRRVEEVMDARVKHLGQREK